VILTDERARQHLLAAGPRSLAGCDKGPYIGSQPDWYSEMQAAQPGRLTSGGPEP
jgi:hypothetical protein